MHVIDNSCNHGGFIPATGLDVTYVRKNYQMLLSKWSLLWLFCTLYVL